MGDIGNILHRSGRTHVRVCTGDDDQPGGAINEVPVLPGGDLAGAEVRLRDGQVVADKRRVQGVIAGTYNAGAAQPAGHRVAQRARQHERRWAENHMVTAHGEKVGHRAGGGGEVAGAEHGICGVPGAGFGRLDQGAGTKGCGHARDNLLRNLGAFTCVEVDPAFTE